MTHSLFGRDLTPDEPIEEVQAAFGSGDIGWTEGTRTLDPADARLLTLTGDPSPVIHFAFFGEAA